MFNASKYVSCAETCTDRHEKHTGNSPHCARTTTSAINVTIDVPVCEVTCAGLTASARPPTGKENPSRKHFFIKAVLSDSIPNESINAFVCRSTCTSSNGKCLAQGWIWERSLPLVVGAPGADCPWQGSCGADPKPGGLGVTGAACGLVGLPGEGPCDASGLVVGGPGIGAQLSGGAFVVGGAGMTTQLPEEEAAELPGSGGSRTGVCASRSTGLGTAEPQSCGLWAVSSGALSLWWSCGCAFDMVEVTEECRGEVSGWSSVWSCRWVSGGTSHLTSGTPPNQPTGWRLPGACSWTTVVGPEAVVSGAPMVVVVPFFASLFV